MKQGLLYLGAIVSINVFMYIKCGGGIDRPGELRPMLPQRGRAEMQQESQENKKSKILTMQGLAQKTSHPGSPND